MALGHFLGALLEERLELFEIGTGLPRCNLVGFGDGRFDVDQVEDLILWRNEQLVLENLVQGLGSFDGLFWK